MKPISVVLLVSSLIVGCSVNKPISEKRYLGYAAFDADLEKCFEKKAMSPKLYADTKSASSYLMRLASVDRNKVSSLSKSLYPKANPAPQTCRKVEALSYQMISSAAGKAAASADRLAWLRNYNNTLNQVRTPITCTRIGIMTTCN